jgi:hypothetical protein
VVVTGVGAETMILTEKVYSFRSMQGGRFFSSVANCAMAADNRRCPRKISLLYRKSHGIWALAAEAGAASPPEVRAGGRRPGPDGNFPCRSRGSHGRFVGAKDKRRIDSDASRILLRRRHRPLDKSEGVVTRSGPRRCVALVGFTKITTRLMEFQEDCPGVIPRPALMWAWLLS